jgi:hypothetical protein
MMLARRLSPLTNRSVLAAGVSLAAALAWFAGPGAAAAQTPVTVTPAVASTAGGSVLRTSISSIYWGPFSATVDGAPATIFRGYQNPWLVAPPHPPGPATILMTTELGGFFTATVTYVDVPQIGLPSPVTAVSRGSLDEPSIIGGNWFGSDSSSTTGDGRYVFFRTDSRFAEFPLTSNRNLYRKDLATGELIQVLRCGLDCFSPSVSLDGSRVAVRWQPVSGPAGIFVLDAPFVSAPVRADVDSAGNPPATSNPGSAMLSGNGRVVAFNTFDNLDGNPADVSGTQDLFVRDLSLGVTERWTTEADLRGTSISADGRFVVFTTVQTLDPSDTNALRDVYLLDRRDGTMRCMTLGANATTQGAAISADGSTVAFSTTASNLVAGDTNGVGDAFAVDVATGVTTRVSVTSAGVQLSTASGLAMATSANGRRIAFTSAAPELTTQPLPPSVTGLFVHDRLSGQTWLANAASDGTVQSPSHSGGPGSPAVAPNGLSITFSTLASNLVADDTNRMTDVFRKELPPDTPVGSNVPAEPVDAATGETPVSLTFDSVAVPGDTSVTFTDTAPELPAGFQLGSRYLEITTTATFSGIVTVCVEYDPDTTPDPPALQLLHYANGAWVDITMPPPYPQPNVVCGQTTSLSPFVLATPPVVTFSVRSLLEEGRVFKAGSTIPIRVQILDLNGANVSAADLPLVATGVRLVSTQTDWATPEDPGQSNPDRTFQFTDVEGESGYRFNLKTTGLAAGTHELRFTVGTGGPSLSVQFQVR